MRLERGDEDKTSPPETGSDIIGERDLPHEKVTEMWCDAGLEQKQTRMRQGGFGSGVGI